MIKGFELCPWCTDSTNLVKSNAPLPFPWNKNANSIVENEKKWPKEAWFLLLSHIITNKKIIYNCEWGKQSNNFRLWGCTQSVLSIYSIFNSLSCGSSSFRQCGPLQLFIGGKTAVLWKREAFDQYQQPLFFKWGQMCFRKRWTFALWWLLLCLTHCGHCAL